MPVKLSDLIEALEFADVDEAEGEAYVDRRTGQTWCFMDPGITGIEDERPDDIDSGRYAQVPSRSELGLGKPLALDFAREHLADDFDDVVDMFSRRGGFERFHGLLLRRGARDRWHAFSNAATAAALRQWCEDEALEVEGEEEA